MYETIFTLTAKTLLTLGGPVCRTINRRRARSHGIDVESAISPTSKVSKDLELKMAKQLKEVGGLHQRDLIDVMAFLRSDEGTLLHRLIAIHCLSTGRNSRSIKSALRIQSSSLLRLYDTQTSPSYADDVAVVLTNVLIEAVDTTMAVVERLDRDSASNIRRLANEQARTRDLLDATYMVNKAEAIRSLMSTMPSDIEEQINGYSKWLAARTKNLFIPTADGRIDVPLAEFIVSPTLVSIEGTYLISPSTAGDTNPLISALSVHNRIVILGQPGGGKSTAVQHAMNTLATDLYCGRSRATPIIVQLRDYAKAVESDAQLGLFNFLGRTLRESYSDDFSTEALKYLLHTGRAILFLDGLDEVLQTDIRANIIDKVANFSTRFSSATFLVTSRDVGYAELPMGSEYTQFIIQPFDNNQVELFLTRFLQHSKAFDDTAAAVDRFMQSTGDIRDIRGNPLMLGVLCNLFSKGRTMPTDRYELYDKCAEMLFDEWDRSRGIQVVSVDIDAARSAVEEMAFEIFTATSEEVSESWIRTYLSDFYVRETGASRGNARTFSNQTLRAWRGRRWILVFAGERDGENFYRFSHRTFLEYFAARQIVYTSASGRALWLSLRDYIRSRSASVFCLLAVELLSKSRNSAGDDFINCAVDEARGEPIDPRHDLSITIFCCQTLSTIRCSPASKLKAVVAYTELLAELIPIVSPEKSAAGPILLSYVDWLEFEQALDRASRESEFVEIDGVRSFLIPEDELSKDFEELTDTSFFAEFTDDYCTMGLRILDKLSPVHREPLMTGLTDYLVSLLYRDVHSRTIALRFALILECTCGIESWARVSGAFKRQLEATSAHLRVQISGLDLRACELELPDFWLARWLLMWRATSDIEFVPWIGFFGLLCNEWPLATVGFGPLSVAQSVLASILRVRVDTVSYDWTPREREALCYAILASLEPFDIVDYLENFAYSADIDEPVRNEIVRASGDSLPFQLDCTITDELTVVESTAAVVLIGLLASINQRRFVMDVLDVARVKDVDALARFADIVMEPHRWDGDGGLTSGIAVHDEFQNLIATLGRHWLNR
jgi:hypothetical protein